MAAPLPNGTLLNDRFSTIEVLADGVFTNAYLAMDRQRADRCVVVELAPVGSVREEDGNLELPMSGQADQMLRQRFLDEARKIGRLVLPCVIPVRATFVERRTAFYVRDHLPDAKPVSESRDPFEPEKLRALAQPLLETLDGLHQRGLAHRCVSPEHLLLRHGRVYLADFTSAMEWLADSMESPESFFSGPFLAPEMHTDRLRRGPATDLYGLAATMFAMWTGAPPSEGASLGDAGRADPALAEAIEAALGTEYLERPQSVAEFRSLMTGGESDEHPIARLEILDERAHKLSKFLYFKRQCPSCKGVLDGALPLPTGKCPVCHDGFIRPRVLSERLCPVCHGGVLREVDNTSPLRTCPICKTGWLEISRKRFLAKDKVATCGQCGVAMMVDDSRAALVDPAAEEGSEPEFKLWSEWRAVSGRPETVTKCDTCSAQFDALPDGRYQQVTPKPSTYRVLYPAEWSRIAAGLEPTAGNAECSSCRADYNVNEDKVTLLRAFRDPFAFAARYTGRLLRREDLRWKGAGKDSPHPGLVCEDCPTEFDLEGEHFRLIRTDNKHMRRQIGQSRTLEDWHRIGEGLPLAGHEETLQHELDLAVVRAYEEGGLPFDQKDERVLWRGPALKLEEKKEKLREAGTSQLVISDEEIVFGGLMKKWRVPTDDVLECSADQDVLTLRLAGKDTPVLFEIGPVEMTVQLEHGPRTVKLNALSLALRLCKRRVPVPA